MLVLQLGQNVLGPWTLVLEEVLGHVRPASVLGPLPSGQLCPGHSACASFW